MQWHGISHNNYVFGASEHLNYNPIRVSLIPQQSTQETAAWLEKDDKG